MRSVVVEPQAIVQYRECSMIQAKQVFESTASFVGQDFNVVDLNSRDFDGFA